jgi:tetratricopeptide (TPR) repeat protein
VAKKKKRPAGKPSRPLRPQALASVREAEGLLRRKEWAKAAELLEDLDRRRPRQRDVLTLLTEAYHRLKDQAGYLAAIERLAPLEPDVPEVQLALAGSYLTNSLPALAFRGFQRWHERWPDHARAGEVRQALVMLEPAVKERLADLGLSGPEGLESAVWHEEVQRFLAQEKYAQSRQLADRLLQRHPQFAPALNNSAEASFREGLYAQAIATARRVLAFDPNNFHTLSNLTRYLCLNGQWAEAREMADRLKEVTSSHPDLPAKKAEALAYLSDDQGVVEAWRGAGAGQAGPEMGSALLNHLAAVSLWRLGQEDEARRVWQDVVRRHPGFDLAQANLADLRKPVGERHAPWPFTIEYWLAKRTVGELGRHIERGGPRSKDQTVAREIRRFLQSHPEVGALLPVLLDRGDPNTRFLALHLALIVQTPELLAALRDFALGQRGPDQMRLEAAQAASQAGLFPAGAVRFWREGKWAEIQMFGWEVYREPEHEHSRQVEELASEATEALLAGDGVRAERLIRRALELEPNAPDLKNNLAVAWQAQGRIREAEDLVRQVHEQHPDYFFGRVTVARLSIARGDLDRARALLDPALKQRRLHISEFTALANAEIDLFLARGEREGARQWVSMLESIDPDNSQLEDMRRRTREPMWRRWLGR